MAASSNPVKTFTKDPDAILDYGINWADWLGDDTITMSTWTVPVGISRQTDLFNSRATVIWMSGGSAGSSYSVVNHVVTAAGRADDRTLKFNVTER